MHDLKAIGEFAPKKAKRFSRLCSKLSALSLGDFPTPVHALKELEKTLGVQNLYIKRDDLSSPFYGGNKVRKLEFYLAQALEHKHTRVLTLGAAGSNHIAGVGYYSLRLGMNCSAICFPQPPSAQVQKNLLFNLRNQVTLHPIPSQYLLPFQVARTLGNASMNEQKPYFIPMGGTSPLGVFAYVLAAFELIGQIESGESPCPKRVYCALGTGGTSAGLVLGFRLAGYPEIEVRPVSVVPKPFCGPHYVAFYANQCNRFLRTLDPSVPYVGLKARDIYTLENQVGSGYGFFTVAGIEAQKAIQESEGVLLEGTYTAKAFAGLLEAEKIDPAGAPVLFWNTINSVNLQPHLEGMDWRQLPKPLQIYFQNP